MQQQEIDYIEDWGGKLRAFEFKWKAKPNYRFPKAFQDLYPDSEFMIVDQSNYDQFLSLDISS